MFVTFDEKVMDIDFCFCCADVGKMMPKMFPIQNSIWKVHVFNKICIKNSKQYN